MKLKRHREDVQWLVSGLRDDEIELSIAKRYRRLILAVEYGLNKNKITREEIEKHGGKDLKRVIKDAEVKK